MYPVTDCDFDTPSYVDPANQLIVGRDTMAWFWDHYAPDPSVRIRPDASPLRAESLAGLPPAVILTAEHDVLRDEGEAYARRLAEHGVRVEHKRFGGRSTASSRCGAAYRGAPGDSISSRRSIADCDAPHSTRSSVGAGFAGLYAAAPPPRTWPERSGVRAGDGVGGTWHWNLEIPRRALRHRVAGLLVLVLGGPRAGMEMERGIRRARDGS